MDTKHYSLNREEFRDKVYGCWTGKSAGGTLGAPYEWSTEMNEVKTYPSEIKGSSLPNDDLDLQLVWLAAAERYGARHINERILSEYWSEFITGPWCEYGVCRNNIALGLTPPLSGSCGNDVWKWSNGAWIRSEIWACIFPGNPTAAAKAAYMDACCDHCGEGIYAEIFTAALESAAFVENEISKLIGIALSYLPEDCRIARAVKLAVDCFEKKMSLKDARNAILEDSKDLGWFQAPGNVGFTVLGLLYGQGDFGKAIAYAINCGDDADCTGGTAGAVMGIILGRKAIPEEWTEPIGDEIKTCSIENTMRTSFLTIPRNLKELTKRIVLCAEIASQEDPLLTSFKDGPTEAKTVPLLPEIIGSFRKFLDTKRPYDLTFDLTFGELTFEFHEPPYIESGKPLEFTIRLGSFYKELPLMKFTFQTPEGWEAKEILANPSACQAKARIVPGEISEAVTYVPVVIHRNDRFMPYTINLPLLRKDAVTLNDRSPNMRFSIHACGKAYSYQQRLKKMNF